MFWLCDTNFSTAFVRRVQPIHFKVLILDHNDVGGQKLDFYAAGAQYEAAYMRHHSKQNLQSVTHTIPRFSLLPPWLLPKRLDSTPERHPVRLTALGTEYPRILNPQPPRILLRPTVAKQITVLVVPVLSVSADMYQQCSDHDRSPKSTEILSYLQSLQWSLFDPGFSCLNLGRIACSSANQSLYHERRMRRAFYIEAHPSRRSVAAPSLRSDQDCRHAITRKERCSQ